jgi:hypothetical protein
MYMCVNYKELEPQGWLISLRCEIMDYKTTEITLSYYSIYEIACLCALLRVYKINIFNSIIIVNQC